MVYSKICQRCKGNIRVRQQQPRVGLTLAHRLRRLPSITPTLGQSFLFAGISHQIGEDPHSAVCQVNPLTAEPDYLPFKLLY